MQANGARIRELRTARGETIEQLAVRVGLSTRTLGMIELGDTPNPRRLTLAAIADALGVSVEEISARDDDASAVPA